MAHNLLWAHLLRKDAASTTTESPSRIPPIAPQDKTGTSMRMLIRDTQANLEKFSTRLDGLLQRVDDCRSQVVNATKLLDVERDKVLSEILEIAHRCQSEMKTHVGAPAQVAALDLLHASQVSTEKSVQALEKRIDALQALLQTNVHALQSIQEQQNTLIGAVMPLVPILHDVAPHMDQIKAALSDMVANAVATITSNIERVPSTLVAQIAHERSSTRVGSSRGSTSSSRRKRSDALESSDVLVSSPLDSRGPHRSLKRARVEGKHAGDAPLTHGSSRLTVPPTSPGDPLSQRTPKTPRRPLADLLLVPGSGIQHHSRVSSTPRGCMRPRETIQAAARPLESTNTRPVVSRPPSIQSPHCGLAALPDPTFIPRCSARRRDVPLTVDQSLMGLPSAAGPSDEDHPLCEAIKIDVVVPKATDVISVHSSPLSSLPSSLPNPNTTQPAGLRVDMQDVPQADFNRVPPSSDPITGASPPKSMSLRDRLAQMSRIGRRETRRFIPLGPWSDEEA